MASSNLWQVVIQSIPRRTPGSFRYPNLIRLHTMLPVRQGMTPLVSPSPARTLFEPTAGYFGAKKGAEPLHIQWNPTTEAVEVVNYNGGNATGLTASAEVRNVDGAVSWKTSVRSRSSCRSAPGWCGPRSGASMSAVRAAAAAPAGARGSSKLPITPMS